MKQFENVIEKTIFFSRWFQLPIYLGLIIGGIIYSYKFFAELVSLALNIFNLTSSQILFGILTLIDISLVANLLIMVIIGGCYVVVVDARTHLGATLKASIADAALWNFDHCSTSKLEISACIDFLHCPRVQVLVHSIPVNEHLAWAKKDASHRTISGLEQRKLMC